MSRNMKFSVVWNDEDSFKNDYKNSQFYDAETINGVTNYHNSLDDKSIKTLFYLLYAKYGNNTIANSDLTQFKYKIFSVIFQYGPTWQKDIEVQDKLRNLSDDDIIKGGKTIYNHAFNDAGSPSTGALEEITYINEQNTQNYKKSKLTSYNELMLLLHTNVTETFINRFKYCFKQMLGFTPTIYYIDDEED